VSDVAECSLIARLAGRMQRSKRHCEVETAFGFGWRYGMQRSRLTGNCYRCKSVAELVTASSQVLVRALGKSGKLETAESDVMSGKQIVGRKNGASRTRPT
jgi:hypothetical protein